MSENLIVKHFAILDEKDSTDSKWFCSNKIFLIGSYDYTNRVWLFYRTGNYEDKNDNSNLNATVKPDTIVNYLKFILDQNKNYCIIFTDKTFNLSSNSCPRFKNHEMNDIKRVLNLIYHIPVNKKI